MRGTLVTVHMKTYSLTIDDVVGSANGERILRLKGPLLISNLFDFQTKLSTDASTVLVIDFTDVPYIDSAGIGALVGAHVNRKKENDRRMLLVGVNQRIRQVLQVTHVEQFFNFADV
jgi:anti-sigma B factor antagonist